jgi:hypothetical protein
MSRLVPRTVSHTQVWLAAIAIITVLLYAAGTQLFVLAVVPQFDPGLSGVRWAARITGFVVAAAVLWRWRWVHDRRRVALWIEEHEPRLNYALVTRLEPQYAGLAPRLDDVIQGYRTGPHIRRAARRAIAPAVLVAAAGIAVLALAAREAGPQPAFGTPGAPPTALRSGAALAEIVAHIAPPAYAGIRAFELRNPETIRALIGSRITVTGGDDGTVVQARLGEIPLEIAGDWRTGFTVPSAPQALRVRHTLAGVERVIVVEPVEDAPPRVQLTMPQRDTLYRTPPAGIAVAAELSDDLGLADAVIEYMISSGEGETFTARTGRVDARSFSGARSGRLSGRLSSETLRLGQGDVLSIRAVARDRNAVSGPGVGTSDTRTIRIARRDEYDSLSIETMAPVFGDSALLSQRMILQLTEALVRELPALSRDSIVRRASAIAFDQERLRDRVHSIVFPGHEHADESPMEGEPPDHADPPDPVNADLRIAYDAMWEAGRELRVASPETAIPPMRTALDALDRARMANRVYLRGGTPRIVVDLQRVRLTGTERGRSSVRSPRAAENDRARILAERLGAVASDSSMAAAARANALNEIRVEALSVSPRAAAPLADATAALRAGREPGESIAAAMAELTGEPLVRERPAPWSGW